MTPEYLSSILKYVTNEELDESTNYLNKIVINIE